MTNVSMAAALIELAASFGVEQFCIGGGSRNSPLIAVLGAAKFGRLFSFADERAAGFFALGRARSTERPVAVITTSGTAAAELLPAAIEAFYSGIPLLLITADRPRRFRRTGAPQAIEQVGIFGPYVEKAVDVEAGEPVPSIEWQRTSPLHMNVRFDEPLIDGDIPISDFRFPISDLPPHQIGNRKSEIGDNIKRLESVLAGWDRPLLLLGAVSPEERAAVRAFALRLGAPVYAEPLSGLREDPELAPLQIRSSERMIARGRFDGVLRIGGVPALRFWRDLEETRQNMPVVSLSALPFSGLSRAELIHAPITPILEAARVPARAVDPSFFRDDARLADQMTELLDQEPAAELTLIRLLSQRLPENSRLFLGNSLPIREWDLVACREPRGLDVTANRGANGIDGEISSFFGGCLPNINNAALLGDLTAIYDLNAPWIVPQLDLTVSFTLFIINNGGGRIFSRVPSLRSMPDGVREALIECTHSFEFSAWAKMWGLDYELWETIPAQIPRARRVVIELKPDPDASRRVWKKYDELWSAT